MERLDVGGRERVEWRAVIGPDVGGSAQWWEESDSAVVRQRWEGVEGKVEGIRQWWDTMRSTM